MINQIMSLIFNRILKQTNERFHKNHNETLFSANKTEENMEGSTNVTEYKEVVEEINSRGMAEKGKFTSFIANHAVFFIAISAINVTLAVLITMACFIFPDLIGNVKLTFENAWMWIKLKIRVGIYFGVAGGSKFALPFHWLWRFLTCVGKCLGIGLPNVPHWNIPWPNIRIPHLPMPSCDISMPK